MCVCVCVCVCVCRLNYAVLRPAIIYGPEDKGGLSECVVVIVVLVVVAIVLSVSCVETITVPLSSGIVLGPLF